MEPTTNNPVSSKVYFKVKGQQNVFEDSDGNLFINDGNGSMIPHDEYLKIIYRDYLMEKSELSGIRGSIDVVDWVGRPYDTNNTNR